MYFGDRNYDRNYDSIFIHRITHTNTNNILYVLKDYNQQIDFIPENYVDKIH